METLAKKFVELELEIKQISTKLKDLRKEKEEISAQLLNCMTNENIECIQIQDHSVVIKSLKQYGSLNREYLQETLSSFCETSVPQDSRVFAEKATDHLLANREMTEKQFVKLLKRR